jgi:hypothetical protein
LLTDEQVAAIRAQLREDIEGLRGVTVDPAWADDISRNVELLLTDRDRLARRVEELDAALRPFAAFARQWNRQPLRNMDGVIYAIHVGTEYEAELSLSDMQTAAALTSENAPSPAQETP